jgi:hypothetical protein
MLQSLGNKAGYIWNGRLEELVCWTYLGHWGVSDGGWGQDLAREQLVKEETKKLFPQPKPVATQGPSLYNELRGEIAEG